MYDPFPPELAACRRCPRLVAHREEIGRTKRRAYQNETYWSKPVPGFGDPQARILLLGLAPGAHGSNRTGRMFTGDASGNFLYPALYRTGLANQPEARHRNDGMELRGVFITSAARCVPPGNKPTSEEVANCRGWLERDLAGLTELRVVLALGAIGHDSYLEFLRARGAAIVKNRHKFAHGALHRLEETIPGALPLLDAYHVSFQNTNTGTLTPDMFDAVLQRAMRLAGLAEA
ncbi:MAG TPA: uracil-DNA glycosylase [Trueperaceae bacterium]